MSQQIRCFFAVFCLLGLSAGAVAAPTATSIEYQNLGSARHLNLINVLPAWALGATGSGVTIAVIDSGIDTDHAEFIGRIDPAGQNFLGGTGVEDDLSGHGTAVAGIIAANHQDAGIVGIAYQANILPYKIFEDDTGGSALAVLSAINTAATNPRVKVLNLSFGGPAPFPGELPAVFNAVANGKFVAVAAGNSAAANPDFPGAFANRVGPGFIAVGALGPNGQIAFFSNRAGNVMNSYLLAPGFNIWTTTPGGSFKNVSGTSFAAAYVSGAAALMFQLFPNLTGNDVGAILLASADDLGPPGPDPTNGRGKLNIGRALDPMGNKTVPAGAAAADGGAPLTRSALQLSPAISPSVFSGINALRQTVFLDSFDRAYIVDLASLLETRPARHSFKNLFATQLEDVRNISLPTGAGHRLRIGYTPSTALWHDRADEDPQQMFAGWSEFGLGELSLSFSGQRSGLSYRLDMNRRQQRIGSIAAGAGDGAMAFMNYHALTTPYLGFSDREYALTTEFTLARNLGFNVVYSMQDEHADHGLQSSAAVAEIVWRSQRHTRINLRMGQLWEQGSLLGGASGGSFSIDQALTRSAGVGFEWDVNNTWQIVANADFGVTKVSAAQHSLLRQFDDLTSDAYSLGLVAKDLWRRNDRLGIAVTRPLRLRRGSAQMSLPVAMDANEVLTRENIGLDLAAHAQQLDFEAYYRMPLGRNTRLASNFFFTRNPGHGHSGNTAFAVSASIRHDF